MFERLFGGKPARTKENSLFEETASLFQKHATTVALVHVVGFAGAYAVRAYFKYEQSRGPWTLYYWPGIPGRGEYTRLIFAEANTGYIDFFQGEVDSTKIENYMKGLQDKHEVFALPALRHGAESDPNSLVLSQSNVIVEYLAKKLDGGRLFPKKERDQAIARSLMNSVNDLFEDGLRSWYPLGLNKTFEEQQEQAVPHIKNYEEHRLPAWLEFFDKCLKRNAEKFLSSKFGRPFKSYEELVEYIEKTASPVYFVGNRLSYVDLCIFHVLDGNKAQCPLAFLSAFEEKKSMMTTMSLSKFPLLDLFWYQIRKLPRIKAWLESPRRTQYSLKGPCC
jgi:glutathione S-transferase